MPRASSSARVSRLFSVRRMKYWRNKQTVARLFDAFWAGDVDVFDDLIVEDYFQHNPQADNGLQAGALATR
jgi:predicted SnoaL-like aldol condensation-catalyzing enzyme